MTDKRVNTEQTERPELKNFPRFRSLTGASLLLYLSLPVTHERRIKEGNRRLSSSPCLHSFLTRTRGASSTRLLSIFANYLILPCVRTTFHESSVSNNIPHCAIRKCNRNHLSRWSLFCLSVYPLGRRKWTRADNNSENSFDSFGPPFQVETSLFIVAFDIRNIHKWFRPKIHFRGRTLWTIPSYCCRRRE